MKFLLSFCFRPNKQTKYYFINLSDWKFVREMDESGTLGEFIISTRQKQFQNKHKVEKKSFPYKKLTLRKKCKGEKVL